MYKPGESADDAGQLAFPVQEGRWKQLPGNEGLKRFFKPKRKPAEKEKPPQHEGEDADDETLEADENEPMWGDDELARIDGREEDPVNTDGDQEPPGGSDDPAMEESGGGNKTPLKIIGRNEASTFFECV